jgi:hypothetical protein
MQRITLDTIGQLHQHGHRMFGFCRDCKTHHGIDLAQLIRERGASTPVIGLAPIQCPSCGGLNTEHRILAPTR